MTRPPAGSIVFLPDAGNTARPVREGKTMYTIQTRAAELAAEQRSYAVHVGYMADVTRWTRVLNWLAARGYCATGGAV